MSGVTGVSGATSAAPADATSDNQTQMANFMGVELQSAESDTISAI